MLRGMFRLLQFAFPFLLTSVASGYEMTRRDRLGVLYSNQVVFDKRGEPLVSVRITEGQKKVEFSSTKRIVLMPGGDDGSLVRSPARTQWTVRIESAQAGQSEWWVAAERLPAHDVIGIAKKRKVWQSRGHTVRIFEAGALLGLSGQTLDTRSITIGLDPKPTRAAAQIHARKLSEQLPLKDTVISDPSKRASGWLIAREQRTGIEIRSRDLIWLTPESGGLTRFKNLEYGHGTPKRGRVDRSYAGDIYIAVGSDGQLAVVNVLSAERLLEGVVPSELYTSAPLEALKAQAVAARGQLLAKVGTRHRSDPYLLCAETHCQVYSGTAKKHPRSSRAVKETRGQLLFFGDELVDTTYSSSCGGHSEAFHQMWGGTPKPYSTGLVDDKNASQKPLDVRALAQFLEKPPKAYCTMAGRGMNVFRWTVKRSTAFVDEAVNKRKPIGAITRIEVLKRGHSGRALAVKYHGTNGTFVLEGSYNNRKLLGNLRSGMWLADRRGPETSSGGEWVFTGGGFGHGVGMCQHGAMGMGKIGKSVQEILKHYYPGSTLKRAW